MGRTLKFLFGTFAVLIALIAVAIGYWRADHVYRQKVFAKFLNKFANVNDTAMMNLRCHGVLTHDDVHGDILEIGSGTGINFPCLYNNSRIQSYIGVEPNVHMYEYFNQYLEQYPHSFNVRLLNNSATDMSEVPSESIDTVIMTLVFCSILDPLPEQVLLEIHRILKPGGKFLFFEHIRSDPTLRPIVNGFQQLIEPIWAILGDGCRFKPMTNYFDQMKEIYSQVHYEKLKMPVPVFFINDALKGHLIK